MLPIHLTKVYDKTSHFRKGNYAPVTSTGTLSKNSFDVTVHMTPELRDHLAERRDLLNHETREAKLLAEGYSVHYAHRQVASRDPEYFRGEQGYVNLWERLGHKNVHFEVA